MDLRRGQRRMGLFGWCRDIARLRCRPYVFSVCLFRTEKRCLFQIKTANGRKNAETNQTPKRFCVLNSSRCQRWTQTILNFSPFAWFLP